MKQRDTHAFVSSSYSCRQFNTRTNIFKFLTQSISFQDRQKSTESITSSSTTHARAAVSTNNDNKLEAILNNLGMSISQWKIHNNASSSLTSKRRRRKTPKTTLEEEYKLSNRQRRGQLSAHDSVKDHIQERIKVKAVHAASSLDTKHMLSIFDKSHHPVNHVFGKTFLIVQLPSLDQAQPRFVAMFNFGSIVFFNVSEQDIAYFLDQSKVYSKNPIPRGLERKEFFELAIAPYMRNEAYTNSVCAVVKNMNVHNVSIVSNIMAQTVALDSHNDTVDELLSTFESINDTVRTTAKFTSLEKEQLFKIVAQNNSLLIDMIAKLGIKNKSDYAWNLTQYERLHEGMRHEFEIDPRFEHIEFKLNMIQDNAKFFLEILQNQKTDTLEWIIIILITFECVLMILEMSGLGPGLLADSEVATMIKEYIHKK
ncbi:hypothetical protein CTEN210_18563 [Chaetoceros tenuissimus]|uniref:DUF155 domain-containing protein n=1 Tax=Chaetoceros tenuissimus TaxID=426638 RepID=A0AAD3HFK2_9STRA|nr:hypothetical protein CTEN210_18563 [Chaetoceros tenuissimus]